MPKKPDEKKLKRIKEILALNPKGLWIRELSRQTRIPISTLHYNIYKHLTEEVTITNVLLSGVSSQYKIIRLKK